MKETLSYKESKMFDKYIVAQYKLGKISRVDAAKASIDFKIKKTVSLEDVMNGKY